MADGTTKRIDEIEVGDLVLSVQMPVLTSEDSVLQWTWDSLEEHVSVRSGVVEQVHVGGEGGYCIINERVFVTQEHSFLVKRHKIYSFCSVSMMREGDYVVKSDLTLEKVESILFKDIPVGTINLTVEETQTFVAEGCVVHNMPPDLTATGPATSGAQKGGAGFEHFWTWDWMHPRNTVNLFFTSGW